MAEVAQKDELAKIVTEVEAAFMASDFDQTAKLFEQNTLACWFGFNHERLLQILNAIEDNGAQKSKTASILLVFLTSTDKNRFFDPELIASLEISTQEKELTDLLLKLIAMFDERLGGHPVRALEITSELYEQTNVLRPYFDSYDGWELFAAVQMGLTAMLAGDFRQALTSFTEARLHPEISALSFLKRDAYVRSALLHASFGDKQQAEFLLEQSQKIPRTISWAETIIDASVTLTQTMLSEDQQQKILDLQRLDLGELNEIWPFYVLALQHCFDNDPSTGVANIVQNRVELLERLPLPHTPGEGFTGSALNVIKSRLAAWGGDISGAQRHMSKADQNIASTRACSALLYAQSGLPEVALELASQMRDDVRGLRFLEIMRLSAMASAYLALDKRRQTLEVLELALSVPRGLSPDEVALFLPPVREFAAKNLAEWSLQFGALPDTNASMNFVISVKLSDEEVSVIRSLAKNKDTLDVAHELFIPLNTLNQLLDSAQAKLGVSTVDSAIIEAERRGLI